MFSRRSSRIHLLLLIILLHAGADVHSQKVFDQKEWARLMASEKDADNNIFNESLPSQLAFDSLTIISRITELEKKIPTSNLYFKARFYCYSAWMKAKLKKYETLSELAELTKKAINAAYTTNDKKFIAYISWLCGSVMLQTQQLEPAVTFKLKADDIYKDIGYPVYYDSVGNWAVLGEALFHTADYDLSILYTKKALAQWIDRPGHADYVLDLRTRYYNTIAQDYEQLNKLDSAILYLDTSIIMAEKVKYTDWIGISSGFKGEVLYKMNEYQRARPLLELDYAINKEVEEDIAAKSLQWLARIDLHEGKTDSALLKAQTALNLLKKADFKYYLQPSRVLEMCYYTLAESFKSSGNTDSFYYYNQLYIRLHDSLQQVALESSVRMVQTKIDNENILHTVQLLEKEKANEEATRNMVIVAIVLISIVLLLYVSRIRLKQRHRENIVMHEKRMADSELISAKSQLQQFTENIIEKSNLIEKLNLQLERKESAGQHDQVVEELTRQTILTEEDWQHFKRMFEKIFPLFFISLKEKASGITIAEQRMAALIRLNLTARQMASMLGISVDSVHKAKQRLRQRMQVHSEFALEEFLAHL